MRIVTLDGCVLCEGKEDDECDFHIDQFGTPVIHAQTQRCVHASSVIQHWCFREIGVSYHRVYVARYEENRLLLDLVSEE